MNKTTIVRLVNSAKKSLSKHSPEILTGIGVAGMVTTVVLSVQATPKALKILEEEANNRDIDRENGVDEQFAPVEITKVDVVKLCWKCYIPAAVTGTVSIVCLIGANSVNARRNAALATAYKLSETAFSDYREKVIETIGEKKEKNVREKVAEKQLTENPVSKNEVVVTGFGDSLCYDPMSGRYFYSSIEKIRNAENKLNKSMIHDICGYASLNDLYDELGLSHIDVGDTIGWNTDNLMDIDISSKIADDGRPAVVILHGNRPDYGFII